MTFTNLPRLRHTRRRTVCELSARCPECLEAQNVARYVKISGIALSKLGADNSKRSRRSDASLRSPQVPKEVSFLSQPQIIDEDIYDATPPTQPEPASAQVAAEESESDEPEEEFKSFKNHRWVDNTIEIQVEWTKGSPTWEPERNLHRDAPDALFAYWKSQGGRPTNPQDPEMFDIFAIRKHSRDKKKLLVEWVGYDKKEMTWLPKAVVEETAKGLVDQYWEELKTKKK